MMKRKLLLPYFILMFFLATSMVIFFCPKDVAAIYSGTNAKTYAYTWVSNSQTLRNPDFQSFSKDCTNYVSQCLDAGGLPQITNSTNDWFHYWTGHVFAYCTNWTNADSLKNYLRDKEINGANISQKIGSWSKYGTGAPYVTYAYINNSSNLSGNGTEVIFYDWEGDHVMNHSALCVLNNTQSTYNLINFNTGQPVYYNGSPVNEGTGDLINQHSSDREKVLWHGDCLKTGYSQYARILNGTVTNLNAYRLYAFEITY